MAQGTAVKQAGCVAPGDHLCLAFDTDDEQRGVLMPYLITALAEGHKVVYLSDGTAPETLTGWFRSHRVDAEPAWARGQLEMRRAEDVFLTSGTFDPEATYRSAAQDAAAARQAGFRGLLVTGEMSWALSRLGCPERLADFEAGLQPVLHATQFSGICQYDRRLFGTREADRLITIHPLLASPECLYHDRVLRITLVFGPPGLAVVGTVDTENFTAVAEALRRFADRRPGDIRLDMAGLDFIDVAGLRVLVECAASLRDRQLHIANLSPSLRRVMELVGWADAPGIVLSEKAVAA
jgi:anti-anti-sigma factor